MKYPESGRYNQEKTDWQIRQKAGDSTGDSELQKSLHIIRKRCGKTHRFFCDGMAELQLPGVKCLASDGVGGVGIIQGITQQRMADSGHVHPDLMGAAGLQLQFHAGKSTRCV